MYSIYIWEYHHFEWVNQLFLRSFSIYIYITIGIQSTGCVMTRITKLSSFREIPTRNLLVSRWSIASPSLLWDAKGTSTLSHGHHGPGTNNSRRSVMFHQWIKQMDQWTWFAVECWRRLVVSSFNLPLWNIMEWVKVSWDDDIPNSYGKIIQPCSKPPISCGFTMAFDIDGGSTPTCRRSFRGLLSCLCGLRFFTELSRRKEVVTISVRYTILLFNSSPWKIHQFYS